MSAAELLAALESSALGAAIRGGGPWIYASLNAAHITGVATLFGAIVVLDLRLLGWRADRPLAPLAAATVPVAGAGLALALLTGLCLMSTNGSEYAGNPLLGPKFAAIALGVANLAALHASRTWRAPDHGEADAHGRRRLALAGGISLASWLAAILCGRFIAYV